MTENLLVVLVLVLVQPHAMLLIVAGAGMEVVSWMERDPKVARATVAEVAWLARNLLTRRHAVTNVAEVWAVYVAVAEMGDVHLAAGATRRLSLGWEPCRSHWT